MWKSAARDVPEAIRETLSYFSVFSYPLTALEIWKFLFVVASLEEILAVLPRLVAEGQLVEQDGKYALPGDEAAFVVREDCYRASLPKLERARGVARYLAQFGFIRAVFVCNSLSWLQARPESDIDFFIVVKHGAIWRARASTVPFLFNRPRGSSERDSLCFSFFLSDQDLDVSRFKIGSRDPYLAVWLASLLPLFDPEGLAARLWQASRVESVFPQLWNFRPVPIGESPRNATVTNRLVPEWLERPLARLQRWYFPDTLKAQFGAGSTVIADDAVLKFHTNDRRQEFLERFLEVLRRESI